MQICVSLYWKIRPGRETECYSEESSAYGGGGSEGRSAILISRTRNQIRTWLHFDTLCLSGNVRLVPDSHLPCLISSHHAPPPPPLHLSPPIPLLFRFISMKNNESKHLQPRLHWCSNTQPADSKTHSGSKWKGEGGREEGGGLLLFQWNYERRGVSGAELIC